MKKASQIPENDAVKIAVVDDHPIVRRALREVVAMEKNWKLSGEAENPKTALRMLAEVKPHLVIVDITFREGHGLDLIKTIRALHAEMLVLVFSHHDELQLAERAIRAGAAGYLMKSEPPMELLTAIKAVLAGEVYLSSRMNKLMLRQAFDRPKKTTAKPSETRALTDRELTVLELLGRGTSTRQIADTLHLSVKTVEAHRAQLKKKLGLVDAVELICYAVRWVDGAA